MTQQQPVITDELRAFHRQNLQPVSLTSSERLLDRLNSFGSFGLWDYARILELRCGRAQSERRHLTGRAVVLLPLQGDEREDEDALADIRRGYAVTAWGAGWSAGLRAFPWSATSLYP
jgi:hypothetical protein